MAKKIPGYHLSKIPQTTPAKIISYIGRDTQDHFEGWGMLVLPTSLSHLPLHGLLFPYDVDALGSSRFEIFPSFDDRGIYTTSRSLLPQAIARVTRGTPRKDAMPLRLAVDSAQFLACKESLSDLERRFEDGILLDSSNFATRAEKARGTFYHPDVEVVSRRVARYSLPVEVLHRFVDGGIAPVDNRAQVGSRNRWPTSKKRLSA